MQPEPPPSSLNQRIQFFFAQARFVSFSLLLHMLIVLFGGSYVMYQHISEPPDFIAGTETGLLAESTGDPMPPSEPEMPNSSIEPSVPTPTAGAASLDAISTVATTGTFALNTAGKGIAIGNLPSTSGTGAKGIGEKLGQLGMGKVGGTSMVRFFGKTTAVTAVVFVVDISGSMVQGSRSAKTYDDLEDEVKKVIRGLDMKTQFGIVAFSGGAHLYKDALVAATNDEKQRAINWLRKQSPVDYQKIKDPSEKAKHQGTRADLGLEAAFKLNPDTVFFVSDGEPTGTNATQVLKLVETWQQGRTNRVKVNAFAYLADSGQKFMQSLAKQTAGDFREINPKDRGAR